MRIIPDIEKHKKTIKKSIGKHGYFSEHNYMHYVHCQTHGDKNIFLDYGCYRGALMQFHERTNVWILFPCGILSPENERLEIFLDVAQFVLKQKKAKKLVVEVSEEMRKGLLEKLPQKNLKARTYTNVLRWPVYNMNSWDTKLRGSKMKKLRNIRNKFYRTYHVRVRDCKDIPADKLTHLFRKWHKRRSIGQAVDSEYYLNHIDRGFAGFDFAKSFYASGKPISITAGWKIPNTSNYYSAIGIYDYAYPGIGEAANIDELNRLKRAGFDYVDFGGSDKVLLRFKRKFRPEKIYKTYQFSIVRK